MNERRTGGYVDGKPVSEAIRLRLTVDRLRELIQDQRRAGFKPSILLVSETERRDLNQDLMAQSVVPVAKADENTDFEAIGVIEGCTIASHPEVPAGSVRIIDEA